MSDFRHKNCKQTALTNVDATLLWEQPWLDGEASYKVIAALPLASIDEVGPTNTAHLRRQWRSFAEWHKKLGVSKGKLGKWKVSAKSLLWLARKLGKTERTVRRYCVMGIVPGAYRTNGGHWRVKHGKKTVNAVLSAIRAFTRCGKTAEQHRKDKLAKEAAELAFKAHAANVFMHTAGISSPRKEKRPFPALVKGAAYTRTDETLLNTAAARLAKNRRRVSATSIAKELGVSRATLYRTFTAKQIGDAKRAARAFVPHPTS